MCYPKQGFELASQNKFLPQWGNCQSLTNSETSPWYCLIIIEGGIKFWRALRLFQCTPSEWKYSLKTLQFRKQLLRNSVPHLHVFGNNLSGKQMQKSMLVFFSLNSTRPAMLSSEPNKVFLLRNFNLENRCALNCKDL